MVSFGPALIIEQEPVSKRKKNICSAILIAQCSKNAQVNMGLKPKEQMLKEKEVSGGSNSLAIIE